MNFCALIKADITLIIVPKTRTHCDLITALSSQIPLIVSLKKRFAKFINRCLSSHNTTLQFISCVAINNPFSRTGTNYRDLLID